MDSSVTGCAGEGPTGDAAEAADGAGHPVCQRWAEFFGQRGMDPGHQKNGKSMDLDLASLFDHFVSSTKLTVCYIEDGP